MIFWALRFLVFLVALIVMVANWRLGVVLLFAVAADFITTVAMVLPLFSVRNELILVAGAALPIGVLIAVGENALVQPWLAVAACSGVLVVLEGSVYLVGLAQGTLQPDDVVQTLPSAVTLVVASGVGILLPAVLFRRRSQRRGV